MAFKKIIKIQPSDIETFVNLAHNCEFDIDVAEIDKERITIDGKSILGVLNLVLKKALIVSCNGEDEEFSRFMEEHAAQSETVDFDFLNIHCLYGNVYFFNKANTFYILFANRCAKILVDKALFGVMLKRFDEKFRISGIFR